MLQLAAGCASVEVDASLPPSLPAHRYETPRAVIAAVSPSEARRALAQALDRATTAGGDRFPHSVGEARFAFSWTVNLSAARSATGHVQEHAFDFAYAEVTPVVVDLRSIGGRQGVKLQRGGADVPYAYFLTPSLADAETICDALAILRGGAGGR